MVSHKIDLEVMLIPDDSKLKKSMDALVNSFQGKLGNAITSGSDSRLEKTITNKVPEDNNKQEEKNTGEISNKGDKKRDGALFKLVNSAQLSLGVLTGIMGILSKVPSILQASLKLMGIGFLLILKPLADLLGMILMPIGIAMIKLASFLMKYSGGAGLGGLVGMILGGILAVIVGAVAGVPTIVLGLIILFGAIAGAVLGSIAGAVANWAWDGYIELNKKLWDSILIALEKWIGLPEEGFWGRVVTAIKTWINNPDDKQSFFSMLVDEFTGLNIGAMITDALKGALLLMFPPAAVWDSFKNFKDLTSPPPKNNTQNNENLFTPSTVNSGIVMGPQVKLVDKVESKTITPLEKMNSNVSINVNGIFEENRLRDIMRMVAEDVLNQHKQVSGSVF